MLAIAASVLPQTPPRYYFPEVFGPGRTTKARAGTSEPAYAIGNFRGGFGCSAAVTRNGFFLTKDWRLVPLCPVPGDVESIAQSFLANSAGTTVVGATIDAQQHQRPVMWTLQFGGTFLPSLVRLPAGSPTGLASDVDNLGHVAGELEIAGIRVPAYWPNAGTLPILFPLLGAGQARNIIHNDVDVLIAGVHEGRFFLWYPNRPKALSVEFPLGVTTSSPRSVRAINPVLAVGSLLTAAGTRAIKLQGTSPVQQLPTLGGAYSEAFDTLASTGQVVGAATDPSERHLAALWEAGKLYDLNAALLSTCHTTNLTLCPTLLLQNANWITSNQYIAAQALVGTEIFAVLLRPIGPLTWTLGACAITGGIGTSCRADLGNTVFSNATPFGTPKSFRRDATGLNESASSTVTAQSVQASASTRKNGATADALMERFIILDHYALTKLLTDGRTTVHLNFHFTVTAAATTSRGDQSGGGVSVYLAVEPMTDPTAYPAKEGSVVLHGGSEPVGSGFLAAYPNAATHVVVPIDLRPEAGAPLRITARTIASFSAGFGFPNPSPRSPANNAAGEVTVRFCGEDPSAITLDDGKSLADHGIRYALWPTLTPGCTP